MEKDELIDFHEDRSNINQMVKTNSESIKVINKNKIKIKQNNNDNKGMKKALSTTQELHSFTDRKLQKKNTDSLSTCDKDCYISNKECQNCKLNEEFIVLLQKEIKRLQNITNDLSYQLIMNGQTPVIKESERTPIDLSINPLRRREQQNKFSDNRIIPSKVCNRIQTADVSKDASTASSQPSDCIRPKSGFRIRDQNSSAKTNCTGDLNEDHCEEKCNDSIDKGPSKVDKYTIEKNFVKKIKEDNVETISKLAINKSYKGSKKNILKSDGKNKYNYFSNILPNIYLQLKFVNTFH